MECGVISPHIQVIVVKQTVKIYPCGISRLSAFHIVKIDRVIANEDLIHAAVNRAKPYENLFLGMSLLVRGRAA